MLTPTNPIGIIPRAISSSSRHRSTAPPPEPPYSSGIAHAEPAELRDPLVELLVVGLAPVVGERVALLAGAALAVGEVADRLDERPLLVGQGLKRHRVGILTSGTYGTN